MSKHSRVTEVLAETDNPEGLSVDQIAQKADLSKQDVVHVLTVSKPTDFVSDVRGRYKIRPLQTEEA